MPLPLNLTIEGSVGPTVVKVLVNGDDAPISAERTYSKTVLAGSRVVGITTIESDGKETYRTIQLNAVNGAVV
jgi:hypothetical protein